MMRGLPTQLKTAQVLTSLRWQGFFVETSDASASSITIPTSAKTTSATSGTFFSKVADIRGTLILLLPQRRPMMKRYACPSELMLRPIGIWMMLRSSPHCFQLMPLLDLQPTTWLSQ